MESFIGMLGAGFPRCLQHCISDAVLSTLDLDGKNLSLEAAF
jgi:hypothetical protein